VAIHSTLNTLYNSVEKGSKNYDNNDEFRHSVWTFTVINCDEVLLEKVDPLTGTALRLAPAMVIRSALL
jgi:hypothetical protein